jgi:hypothetical protein
VATSSRKRSHEDANATNGDEEEGEAEDNGDNTVCSINHNILNSKQTLILH